MSVNGSDVTHNTLKLIISYSQQWNSGVKKIKYAANMQLYLD